MQHIEAPTMNTEMGAAIAGEHWVEALDDGSRVLIRPLREEDRERELAFLRRLSPDARRNRFLGDMREVPSPLLDQLMTVDNHRSVAFVALAHDHGELREVGISRYSADAEGNRCECAVTVADDWRHRGLDVALMQHLITVARREGFQAMYSTDFTGNNEMRQLGGFLGFELTPDPNDSTLVVHTLPL